MLRLMKNIHKVDGFISESRRGSYVYSPPTYTKAQVVSKEHANHLCMHHAMLVEQQHQHPRLIKSIPTNPAQPVQPCRTLVSCAL